MYKIKKAMFLNVLTSMHVGGGSELSVVDLPIQREGHTGFPKIEASSLKGSLRSVARHSVENSTMDQIFGSDDTEKKEENRVASAVAFSDARLLFFPVRSAKGVFAFVTCPMVLRRFFDDMELAGSGELAQRFALTPCPLVAKGSALVLEDKNKKTVMLEEYVYDVTEEDGDEAPFGAFLTRLLDVMPCNELLRDRLKTHAILVPDDDFSDFVRMSTEVVTRIKIDNTSGTVQGGALFNEEYLPSESVLYSLLFIADAYQPQPGRLQAEEAVAPPRKKAAEIAAELEKCIPPTFQIGANQTLGKGFVACRLVTGGGADVQ
ncbi:type III-B CRISPR module RAMP protein Cmr4 [Paenibacillus dendritiformis]|uniref:type III-B CRISPR module RAMP protein Cmr4 n=1 Tax=Paenibacillus dendritiformis TaxID=130049 RepID=UPI00248CAC7F|nr:type III-B CRISPR module RAMP protein Cmr4 [Paenibacillus dendritiformis]WGU92362.1 type III-B CRISPR module RAMP protein Cmr4 [Paenibacillus dendritiformis]